MNVTNFITKNIDNIIDDYVTNKESIFKNKKVTFELNNHHNVDKSEIQELYNLIYDEEGSDSNKKIENTNINPYSNEIKNSNDNHDEYNEEDELLDLYEQKYYKSNINENLDENIKIINEHSDINNDTNDNKEIYSDSGMYYIYLINLFIKYYNNKYDKNNNFFDGIKDSNKDTSNLMELFFEAIIELKLVKKYFDTEDENLMEIYYTEDSKEIDKLFVLDNDILNPTTWNKN